jgi:alpha-D-glucose phosphate-specific phosphoglucomutase
LIVPIKFGTDGWRAIIADDFTFDNVRICAQAVSDYLKGVGLDKRGLVIGYDTRFASEDFAAVSAEVAAANGIKVYLCQVATPTPVTSYAVLYKEAGGGIIITASHNPGRWSGFKYKEPSGCSASTEVISTLERNIGSIQKSGRVNRMLIAEALEQGLAEKIDPYPEYYKQIGRLVDLDRLRKGGLKVMVDSMYGAGSGYFKKILSGVSTEVIEIHGERNPAFPGLQPEPIASNLGELSQKIKGEGADVGLATDGDADRIGIMDENGRFLTTLEVFALLALYLLEVRGEKGAIVKTITTTSMLYRLGEIYGVPVHETSVGFKYVAPIMSTEDALIGGEESGGFGFRGHIPERDGILAGLLFLDFMIRENKSPSQLLDHLFEKVGPHYYDRVDIDFPASERDAIIRRLSGNTAQHIDGTPVSRIETADGFRFLLDDGSWLLIRFSGTEPIMRVYSESDDPDRVQRFISAGREMAGV